MADVHPKNNQRRRFEGEYQPKLPRCWTVALIKEIKKAWRKEMKGIELAKAYYKEYGRAMLEGFPELLPFLAAGIAGSGSECFGYDDDISRDHDFEPGFCIFLPGEDVVDRKSAFALERAYAKLPKEFCGYKRLLMQPGGGSRHGVIRICDFMADKTGTPDGELSAEQWLSVPETALSEVSNGEIFFDNYGAFTRIRERVSYYPEDIRRKKLAGHLMMMSQSGQYNYTRCLKHGEHAAAQLAVFEFAKSTMEVIFLLNRRYQPYYKWSFRAMRELPVLSVTAELLEYLITSDNYDDAAEEKYNVIEGIVMDIIDELNKQQLSQAICGDLEKHAFSVNDSITDSYIRNLHILAAL